MALITPEVLQSKAEKPHSAQGGLRAAEDSQTRKPISPSRKEMSDMLLYLSDREEKHREERDQSPEVTDMFCLQMETCQKEKIQVVDII